MSSLEESILAARARLRDRVRSFSAADAPLFEAAAGYLSSAGGAPVDVTQVAANYCIALVVDPEAFYDVAHLVTQRALNETQRLEDVFQGLLYGPNGVLNWSVLSLNADAYDTARLQELQELVRRGRFARSEITESVSVDVLERAREAALELANFVVADGIAELPLQSTVEQAIDDLAALEGLLSRVTTIRGEFESAGLRGFAIARVLDKIDLALERALDQFVETNEIDAATDVLASLATIEATLEILLQDVERFGNLRVPEAVLLPDFQQDILDVTLRALPERARNRRTAAAVIEFDGTASITSGSLDETTFEESITCRPSVPSVQFSWARPVDRLVVAGQATTQSSQEADATVPLVTQVEATPAITTGGNRRIYVEDATAAEELIASSSAAGDVKVLALVGDYDSGSYLPVSDADAVASPNWIEIPASALFTWDLPGGVQNSAAGYSPPSGTPLTFLPAVDRISVDTLPVVSLIDNAGLDESDLSILISAADGSSARETWPFDMEDLEDDFAITLGFSGAELTGIALGDELGASDYPGAGGVQSGNAVDFSITLTSAETESVILRGPWGSNGPAVASQLLGRRLYFQDGATTYARLVQTATFVTADDENDALGTRAEDIFVILSEPIPRSTPPGWCFIDRNDATRTRNNQVRYLMILSGSVQVGDVLYIEDQLVTVLSVAGALVLLNRALDLSADPTTIASLSAKRYRGISPGDVLGDTLDTFRWNVDSLTDTINVSPQEDDSALSYPVTLEQAAIVPRGGERTTRYLVLREDEPLDLYFLDDYFRRRLSDLGTITLAPSGPEIRWAISAGNEARDVIRLSNFVCRIPDLQKPWGQDYSGVVVALSRDGSRTGLAQTIEPYVREDGSVADVRVQGLTMLDLDTDNRMRLARGTYFSDTAVTTAISSEIPVRRRFQGPVYRGGARSYGRWALISYRVTRRDRQFDYEELRTEIGRSYADLGARTIDSDTGTGLFEADGTEVLLALDSGLGEIQLIGLDLCVVGDTVPIPARIAEVLTYTSSTSAFVRLSRTPFSGVVPGTAVAIELKETVLSEAARELYFVYTYLRDLRETLSLSQSPGRSYATEAAQQLTQLGSPRVARAVRSGKFDVLTELFQTSRTSEELAESLDAVVNLASTRNSTFLSNPS